MFVCCCIISLWVRVFCVASVACCFRPPVCLFVLLLRVFVLFCALCLCWLFVLRLLWLLLYFVGHVNCLVLMGLWLVIFWIC